MIIVIFHTLASLESSLSAGEGAGEGASVHGEAVASMGASAPLEGLGRVAVENIAK